MPVLSGGVVSLAVKGAVTASSGQVRKIVNVFSYQNTAGPGPPFDLNGLAAHFLAQVLTPVWPFLSSDYVGNAIIAYTDTQLAPPGIVTTQVPPNGGTTGSRLPTHICINFWARTAFRGRSYRSVRHFGPVPSSAAVKDELTPAVQSALQVQLNHALDPLSTADGNIFAAVLLSRQLSSEGPPRVFVGAPLVALIVNRTLGLCRHRRERTVIPPT